MPCWKRSPFIVYELTAQEQRAALELKCFIASLARRSLKAFGSSNQRDQAAAGAFRSSFSLIGCARCRHSGLPPVCTMTHDRPRQKRSQGFSVPADPEKWLWMLLTEPGSLVSSSLCWRGNTSIATMSERKYMYLYIYIGYKYYKKGKNYISTFSFYGKGQAKIALSLPQLDKRWKTQLVLMLS